MNRPTEGMITMPFPCCKHCTRDELNLATGEYECSAFDDHTDACVYCSGADIDLAEDTEEGW